MAKKIVSAAVAVCIISAAVIFGCAYAGSTSAEEIDSAGDISFVLLGDSIADGIGCESAPHKQYGSIISDEMGYTLINDALSGDDTSDLIHKLENDEKIAAHIKNADIIAVSIGGNNLLKKPTSELISIAAGGINGNAAKRFLSDFDDGIRSVAAKIREINSAAPIYFQTVYNPFACTDKKYFKLIDGIAGQLAERGRESVNEAVAADENAYAVDVFGDFTEYCKENGLNDLVAADGVHPSEKGNRRIADLYLELLKRHTAEGRLPSAVGEYKYKLLGNFDSGKKSGFGAEYDGSKVSVSDGRLIFENGSGERQYDGVRISAKAPKNAVGIRFNARPSSGEVKLGALGDEFDTGAVYRASSAEPEGTDIAVMFADHTSDKIKSGSVKNLLIYVDSAAIPFSIDDVYWIVK